MANQIANINIGFPGLKSKLRVNSHAIDFYIRTIVAKRFSRLFIVMGLSLLSKNIHAQIGDTLSNHNNVINVDIVIGPCDILPIFKHGGEGGLRKFLVENIVYPDSLKEPGRVLIELTVDTVGKVSGTRLANGFNKFADQEAMRVCRLLEYTLTSTR